MYANRQNFHVFRKSGLRNIIVMSDFSPEVAICACTMTNMQHNRYYRNRWSLWTRLWGRYHVPQNVLL